jgi:hypothetical protein
VNSSQAGRYLRYADYARFRADAGFPRPALGRRQRKRLRVQGRRAASGRDSLQRGECAMNIGRISEAIQALTGFAKPTLGATVRLRE